MDESQAVSGNLDKKKPKTKAKSFSCPTCNKTFTTKSYLEKHKTIHSGEQPYSCTHCDKRFVQKGDLKQHEKIHSGEKPLSCSTCNKTFVQKSNLKRHEKVCNKTFIQNDALEKQEITHKGEEPYKHFIGPEKTVKVQVKEELNFEEITIKEEFIPDE